MGLENKRMLAIALALSLVGAGPVLIKSADPRDTATPENGQTNVSKNTNAQREPYDGSTTLFLTLSEDNEQIEREAFEPQLLSGDIIDVDRVGLVYLDPNRNIALTDLPDRHFEVNVRTDISVPQDEQITQPLPISFFDEAYFIPVLGKPFESPIDNIGDTEVNPTGKHGGLYYLVANQDRANRLLASGEKVYLRGDQLLLNNVPREIQEAQEIITG